MGHPPSTPPSRFESDLGATWQQCAPVIAPSFRCFYNHGNKQLAEDPLSYIYILHLALSLSEFTCFFIRS
jgi:hypothetical protein